jgi:hypothetical protein
MQDYELPKLPDGYRYGADCRATLPVQGGFQAPEGCVIKSVDIDDRSVVYVPIQQYINGTWYTVKL